MLGERIPEVAHRKMPTQQSSIPKPTMAKTAIKFLIANAHDAEALSISRHAL